VKLSKNIITIKELKTRMDRLALILVLVGALNWGLIGIFGVDLVALISGTEFGGLNTFSRIIYTLVGLAGLYSFSFLFNDEEKHANVE
jgi:uncharacterized membrane protein YuzA (DUF378 family)